ncbi:hypothetical protein GCM10023086_35910 [Streptomyces venetus]|uniref:DNA primase n=1 Tax=Streptomyces venetus TaxID=1701086 RepID=A0ABP8G048_9ACTN
MVLLAELPELDDELEPELELDPDPEPESEDDELDDFDDAGELLDEEPRLSFR